MAHPNGARRLTAALAALALLVLPACGGAPRIRVTSQPETARVYVNGILVGTTPTDITLPFHEGKRVFVQVVHPSGRQVGQEILTAESLPQSGEKTFELR